MLCNANVKLEEHRIRNNLYNLFNIPYDRRYPYLRYNVMVKSHLIE